MNQDIVLGQITYLREDGTAVIQAAVPSFARALNRQYDKVLVAFRDSRRISPEQRAKAHALIREIADWMGDRPESAKKLLKLDFITERMAAIERRMFSLADVDMATACDFIAYLVDFVIDNDVPTQRPLYELADDIGRYIYACIMSKKCCVCGRASDLHHCTGSKIGMGGNRETAHHLGRLVLPLCREHHTIIHQESEREFWDKYHLVPVKVDRAICRKYKLKE